MTSAHANQAKFIANAGSKLLCKLISIIDRSEILIEYRARPHFLLKHVMS